MTDAPPVELSDSTNGVASAAEAAPDWVQQLEQRLTEFEDKVSGRLSSLGKDMGRLRERIPKTPSPPQEPTATAGENGASAHRPDADVHRHILALATKEASLSDEQRAWLDEHTAGMDLAAREQVLNAYLAGQAATAGEPKTTPKNGTVGRAATAATRTSAAHPSSRQELIALMTRARNGSESAKQHLAKLKNDPSFSAQF